MEDIEKYSFFLKQNSLLAKTVYWIVAAILMFFLFSSNSYDIQIRIILVIALILMSIAVSYFINNYLIHSFLFKGKFLKFIYFVIYTFIISFWVNFLSLFIILVYTSYYKPQMIIPQSSDIIILLTGNYLVILLSAIFHFIKETYRKLIEKNEVEIQKHVAESKLQEAKLKLLQGQIHPHFLFNMLNNLYGLVSENSETSKDVIIKLSDLLDYMLYKCDKPSVFLNDEIQFINNYIELERIRHDEHFNVSTHFAAIPDNIKIAPLILFPFVENAFKHGFHNPSGNFINLNLNIVDQQLNFTIENSISEVVNDKYLKQEGRGIGLNNIKERLEMIYTGKYHLDIKEDKTRFAVKLVIDFN